MSQHRMQVLTTNIVYSHDAQETVSNIIIKYVKFQHTIKPKLTTV